MSSRISEAETRLSGPRLRQLRAMYGTYQRFEGEGGGQSADSREMSREACRLQLEWMYRMATVRCARSVCACGLSETMSRLIAGGAVYSATAFSERLAP